MVLTAPQEASVVMAANSEDMATPKRTSLPSILPVSWATFACEDCAAAATAALPCPSAA
jgi:hypothetical protein